ncbi:uncharacterized protein LOC129729397 [Wyeomyia smithii]|uniref:uncharacterized protein LOC129729397 n=1 Tax=Wyeomyia smithii TaxID=174621 RepID=UPI002467E449|nr:uncharacterized protein LOC129729397 [Wyeomyia smithii]XP_055543923.1 uncharacterized protein LOC129729397 [Wyeomyia smithii]XP_055543924.1 uncharacterized protein LOC129729397 [Wyeomyia smithii]XP_055543925.1 uncharacterized protein LOC129729397 [Wyeomyia smithii]
MKPSPKKPLTSKLKQRSKSSVSTGSHSNSTATGMASSANSNNIGNNVSGLSHSKSNHHNSQSLRTTGGSDTNSSGNDGNIPSVAKDKSSFQSYAGFSSRSIRTIWEQHDKQETEVSPEVYSKLAEDTTYKLWELTNNIKTYGRHSSGKITYDLVNEVLKDCDIPPIVGANNEPWDKIEYDGVYFFNSDEVLDLREEYIKDVTIEQSNIPVLTTTWMAESAIAEDLLELYNNVCDAIYIGDEECFEEAIEILSSNPHVPSLMKLLLTKVIEMLGFEYAENTLTRSLQFIEALVRNYHVAHSDLTLELSLLSQIFVNLLLGPPSLVNAKFVPSQQLNLDLQPQSHASQQQQPLSIAQNGTESSLGSGPPSQNNLTDQLQAGFNHSAMVPMNILENQLTGPSEDSNNSNSNTTEELLRSIGNIKEGPDEIDINNIKDEYEALFSMVQGLGKHEEAVAEGHENITGNDEFQIKTEFNSEFDASSAPNFLTQQSGGQHVLEKNRPSYEVKQELDVKLKEEPEDPDENISLQMSESTNGEVINPNSTTLESENITTMICGDHLVDDVSRIIGLCASKWGFVEQECTFLLVERLQRYFGGDKKPFAIDYNWLTRLVRGLWAVGEFAFREMSPYFECIDPDSVPEFVNCYLNSAAVFLRGRSDIFFHEYLNELCADGLVPFLFQYEQYIEKKHQNYHRICKSANQSEHCYKIKAKILLKTHVKCSSLKPPPSVNDLFPERSEKQLGSLNLQPPAARFSFRFAGCRPVALKNSRQRILGGARSSLFGGQERHAAGGQPALRQNDALLQSFHTKVVIARRKLLPSDTNQCIPHRVHCYGSTII